MIRKVNLNIATPRSKTSWSSWLLGVFCLTLVVSGLSSIFFQAPVTSNHELNRYRSLFSREDITQIRELTITNRLGRFTFARGSSQDQWKMTSPRSVMANKAPIERTLNALMDLKIRRIFDRDPISVSNFSLENPLSQLEILKADGVKQKILFGLMNPIDNSTYLMFENGDVIFHIDSVNFMIESLDLANFIDSRIFPVPAEELKSFKIFRGPVSSKPQLALFQENETWKDFSGRNLEPTKVKEYLAELAALRSLFIIDKKTDEMKESIEQYLSQPLYTIEVTNQADETFSYTVSQVIDSLPEIKIERRQNFIIQASSRDYPFLLNKEALELLNKRSQQFSALEIKKLFY